MSVVMTANRLREIREAKGLSVEEVATRMGVTSRTIIYHENGERELTGLMLDRYRQIYKVKAREIYVAPTQ